MTKQRLYILTILFALFSGKYSVAQHDSDSLKNILVTEILKDNFIRTKINFNDSVLDMFHKVEPTYSNDILPADLGNIGSAYISEDFFKRPDEYKTKFLFNLPYDIYLTSSENAVFFNTRRPYTSILHTTSTKVTDLQTIDFIHTQNVNPLFNFGIRYNFISSLGQFLDQANSLNTVSLTSNYNKDRYSVYAAYVFNKFKVQNSGGYIDTLGIIVDVPEHNLKNSNTHLLNTELSITQKYKFGTYKNFSYKDTVIKVLEPRTSISHNITVSKKYRLYRDEENQNNNYYLNYFYQKDATYDSAAVKSIANKIRFGSEEIFEKENKFGFSLILTDEFRSIYNFKDYIFLQNENNFIENNIKAGIYTANNKKIGIDFSADYFFGGYRGGDYRIETNISKNIFKEKKSSLLNLNVKYTHRKPDYFQTAYFSNHYRWENDFDPITEIFAKFSFNMPRHYFSSGFNSAFIKKYIWYDITSEPSQYDTSLFVMSAYAGKDFRFKKIVFVNKILWQKSSDNDIISLPTAAIYQSSYIIMKYQTSLLVHLGYEVYYSTEYKMFNYNPALGQFYFINNTRRLAGNYPYVTVFADLKIKRNVMLFFKMLHINSLMNQEYLPFYVNHYPLQKNMFKFGVRWTFKN